MAHDASKDELIASIGELVSNSETLGFPQTREILLVALTVLSQEIRRPTNPLQVAGRRAAYANLDHEADWHAKEEIYLQALIEAQDDPEIYTCSNGQGFVSANPKLPLIQ